MKIQEGLLHIMENYLKEKNLQFKQNKLAGFLRNEIIEIITESNNELITNEYILKGSPGAGNWAEIPWISIFNRNITNSAQKGIYIVFLFSSDMSRVYLSLNQGYTFYKENNLEDKIEGISEIIRNLLIRNYDMDDLIHRIDLNSQGELGRGYEKGNIISKVYTKEELTNKNINIEKYIEYFLHIYKYLYNIMPNGDVDSFYKSLSNKFKDRKLEEPILDFLVKESNIEQIEMIDHIDNYIKSKGFIFKKKDIANLYLSIKTKPFVLLAGISGTGKSKMVQLFSEAIGATKENGRYNLISVKPDWNDGTELFGYIDIQGEYIPGILSRIIKDANKEENLDKPYIICLDEMNLARVEYYLSDYLSIIETRERSDGSVKTARIFPKGYLKDENKYNDIYFSDNIHIIGTVNMDDTTFGFSKKVLDRANTIEFSNVDLNYLYFPEREVDNKVLNNNNFETGYLTIKEAVIDNKDYVEIVNNFIIRINLSLEKYNMHFGYRIRDEIVFYMLENNKNLLLSQYEAFDYQILQKILPRINGSELEIKLVLIDLHNLLNEENEIIDSMNYLENISIINSSYPKSTKKIREMLRSYENGYVSFW